MTFPCVGGVSSRLSYDEKASRTAQQARGVLDMGSSFWFPRFLVFKVYFVVLLDNF